MVGLDSNFGIVFRHQDRYYRSIMIHKAHVPVLLERLITLLWIYHLREEVRQTANDFTVDHLELKFALHAVFVWLSDPKEERSGQLCLLREAGSEETVLSSSSLRLSILCLHVCQHCFNFEIIRNQVVLSVEEQLLSWRRGGAWETQTLVLKHLSLNKDALRNI